MKKTTLFGFLCIILLSSASLWAQRSVRIGYIDMDVILQSVTEYQKANSLLDKNIENWKKEIALKKIQLKQMQEQLNIEKVLLTPELIADKELEIQDFSLELIALQEKRFGPQGDLIQQRTNLLQPIQDQILSIVQQVAEERRYDFIFDRSSDAFMLYSAKNYDISDLVLKRINRQQRIQERKEQIEAIKNKTNSITN
ncbi:MAG: OmpH family outer membrane protein [Flavobacteriaceae bacterium]|jgi:Skp family chaperone for outer membrane proteins